VSAPGPHNLITDVAGLTVGNAEDLSARTGVTVVLPDEPAVAAVDVRGGGTGTRDVALLDPSATVQHVHALVLSGGSAFGLDAAGGVMAWLAERGRGLDVRGALVPIVPSAILFDLANGGDKAWDAPPFHALARAAADAAGAEFALGNAGAGLGATAGALKGGLGSASVVDDGMTVGALAAVNSHGETVMPGTGCFWAWPFERDGEFGGTAPPAAPPDPDVPERPPFEGNTTLAIVATDVALDKAQATRLAIMAQDGLARAIRPVHTPFDGDVVFALSTGRQALREPLADLARLGTLAADCVARACARAVYEAETLGDWPSYREVHG